MQVLPPNTRISHYVIVSQLGAGGMGVVYLAQDTKLDRKVALKILPAELAANPERMERFVREAKSAAALSHPNIGQIFEIGSHQGNHFIAMEFVDGDTLKEKIHRDKTNLDELLRYLQQVSHALSKAHAAGIIHRDLKPDNIMITRDGYSKVLDFGLAKFLETQNPYAELTASSDNFADASTALMPESSKTGTIIGTVGYMSPEQARGDVKDIDQRSDIFSFGCILFEAATRQRPFQGSDALDSLHRIIHAPTPDLKALNPNVPADLQRIVARCLEKDRENRYQSIKEVAIELKNVRSNSFENKGATDETPKSIIQQHRVATVLLALLILAGVAAVAIFLIHGRQSASEGAIESIAVLPFENQNRDNEIDYLSDGITESIINSLTQLPNLKVIARSSVFRYKDRQTDPLVAGKELGVRAILTGRVLQRGDSLTISTELVDVGENKQLWGEKYERKLSDLLVVQRDIANDITSKLRLKLSGTGATPIARHYTDNPEAYQLYLKGRFFINKRTEADLRKALDFFQQVVAEDPDNALAYTGLSDAYTGLVFPLGSVAPREAMPRAREAALQALAIDNTLPEAHNSLAYETFFYEWDWPVSEREFKRAIELNPNDADAHHNYSHYLMAQQRVAESLAESKRALELSPIDLVINIHLGWHYLNAREPDKAIEQLNKVVEMDRDFAQTYPWLGLALEEDKRYPEAIAAFQNAVRLFQGTNTESQAELAHAYAVSGNKTEALKRLAELLKLSPNKYVAPYHIAAIYTGLGDKDQAFTWLQKAYDEKSAWMVNLPTDYRFDDVRSDPRFVSLMKQMKFTQ